MAAITATLYRKHPETWWIGKRARLLRAVEKRSGEILPVGMEVTIRGKFSGFDIQGDACKCCGVTPRCHKLDIDALELIEEVIF